MRPYPEFNQSRQPWNYGQAPFVPLLQPLREAEEPGVIGSGRNTTGRNVVARTSSPCYSLDFDTFMPSEPSTGVPAELEKMELKPTPVVPETRNPNQLPARDLFKGVRALWDPRSWAEDVSQETHVRQLSQPTSNDLSATPEAKFPSISHRTSGDNYHHHQSAPPAYAAASRAPKFQVPIGREAARRQLFPEPTPDEIILPVQPFHHSVRKNMSDNAPTNLFANGFQHAASPAGTDRDLVGGVSLQQMSAQGFHQKSASTSQSFPGATAQQPSAFTSQSFPGPGSQQPSAFTANYFPQPTSQQKGTGGALSFSAPVFQPASAAHGRTSQEGNANEREISSASANSLVQPFGTFGFGHQQGSATTSTGQNTASSSFNNSAAQNGSFEDQQPQVSTASSAAGGSSASEAATAGQQTRELSPEHRARAKRLVEFIKAGGLELPGVEIPPDLADYITPGPASSAPPRQQFHQPGSNRSGQQVPPAAPNNGFLGMPLRISDPIAERWYATGAPTWAELAQNIVFAETARDSKPHNFGVLKITDVPYNVTKDEILHLMGDRAAIVQKPVGTKTGGIHIVMERSTAKSMDCYVEFDTPRDAELTFNRLDASVSRRMIQHRRVDITFSSQEVLMKDLFPRAKCVTWHGPNPVITAPADANSAPFSGFVTNEEMIMTVKFGHSPQRSRFALKHQQRPFESIMSLLLKYPWHEVWNYTVGERDLIFKTTREMIYTLSQKLQREEPRPHLDQRLLDDMLQSSLLCPAFNEKQRAQLIDATNGFVLPRVYVSPVAHEWPFEVLNRRSDSSVGSLMYVIDLLKRATTLSISSQTSLAQASAMRNRMRQHNSDHFGNFTVPYPPDKDQLSMGAVALLEWQTIEGVLRTIIEK